MLVTLASQRMWESAANACIDHWNGWFFRFRVRKVAVCRRDCCTQLRRYDGLLKRRFQAAAASDVAENLNFDATEDMPENQEPFDLAADGFASNVIVHLAARASALITLKTAAPKGYGPRFMLTQ